MEKCVTEKSPKPCHVDDVLDKFSIYGRYHLRLMALSIIANITNCAYGANFVFAAGSVEYRCKDSYDNVSRCTESSNTSGCEEWEYEDPYSFVAEFGLACQDWKRTLVGTAHSIGYMAGLLLVGPMSDKLGRKLVVIVTGVLGGVFGLARSFLTWYWIYIAMEILESALGDICSPLFVLDMETVSAKNKIQFNMFCGLGYAFGGIIMSVIAWLVPYWRTFLQVIYAPAFFFVFYLFLLDESPRWLIMRGKKEKAIRILYKAAEKNNINLDKNILENLSCETAEGVKYLDFLRSTFKSAALRLRFIVCVIWWSTSTFVNYGLVINSVSLPGNKYVNFALTSVVELPGTLLLTYIMLHFKRKQPLMMSFLLGGLLCVIQSFMPEGLPWLSISVYMIGKLVGSIFFGITYIYTLELFPTYTRNSMHALCSSLGRIGSIVAPQMPLLLPIWSGLPTIIFGLSAVIAGLTTLLVPDIFNDALPDTVREAEALGKSKFSKAQGGALDHDHDVHQMTDLNHFSSE